MTISLNNRSISLLEYIFLLFLSVIYIIPNSPLGATTFLLLLLAYTALLALLDPSIRYAAIKILGLTVLISLAYLLLTESTSIAQGASNRGVKRLVSKIYQYYSLYFPVILLMRLQNAGTYKQKKGILIVVIATVIYVIATTWLFLLENPNATREWGSFDENAQEGVANYYFIYAIPILIGTITAFAVKWRRAARYFIIAIIAIAIIFLVNAQYTLSILIALIGVTFQIDRSIRSGKKRYLFRLMMVLAVFFMPTILKLAIDKIPSEQVTTRLAEIYDFLTGKGAGGYNLNGRLTLYGDTIKAFFRSPLWGNRDVGFDGHATFLTVLADTGILGGIPFYALYLIVCKTVSQLTGACKKYYSVVILMFTLMGLTNPVHASLPLGFVAWFVAPMLLMTVLNKEEKKNAAAQN